MKKNNHFLAIGNVMVGRRKNSMSIGMAYVDLGQFPTCFAVNFQFVIDPAILANIFWSLPAN